MWTFREAAQKYLKDNQHKKSVSDDERHLAMLDPFIGDLLLSRVYMETLRPFIEKRNKNGMKTKTINLSLETVRRILRLAADDWRTSEGRHGWKRPYPNEIFFDRRRNLSKFGARSTVPTPVAAGIGETPQHQALKRGLVAIVRRGRRGAPESAGNAAELPVTFRRNSRSPSSEYASPCAVAPGLTFRRNRCRALARPLDSPPPAVANVATEARISCPVARLRLRPALRAV